MANKKSKTAKKIIIIVEVCILLLACVVLVHYYLQKQGERSIALGLNVELSGSLASVGTSSKQAAELAVQQVNKQGGIMLAGKKYHLVLDIGDNQSSVAQTKAVTDKLIADGVIAMIGPNASTYAIAASDIAESSHLLMLSPWSTDPLTTLHKQYVYRVAFLDPFQGQALADFATQSLHVQKAAILYDKKAAVLRGQSDDFQTAFTHANGKVVAVMDFSSGTKDFSSRLTSLMKVHPQVIFLPAYYTDAAEIIKQARAMGITIPFLGSDAWGGQQILNSCGGDCNGVFYSAHYAPDTKNAKTMQFAKLYEQTYHEVPDDVAALTYDSVTLLIQALQSADASTREALVSSMHKIIVFDGVTGRMHYTSGSGDPKKTVVIMGIDNNTPHWVTDIQPR